MASDSLKLDFSDNIQATLSLTLSSGAYSVPGGNITALSLDIQPWGFSGEITFVVMAYPQTDALYTPFQAAATIPLGHSTLFKHYIPTRPIKPCFLRKRRLHFH